MPSLFQEARKESFDTSTKFRCGKSLKINTTHPAVSNINPKTVNEMKRTTGGCYSQHQSKKKKKKDGRK
jgi:hypothetical protein